jgi:hypothetical protein
MPGPGCFLFRENNIFLFPLVARSAVVPLTIRLTGLTICPFATNIACCVPPCC